jgi:hypothetical protein
MEKFKKVRVTIKNGFHALCWKVQHASVRHWNCVVVDTLMEMNLPQFACQADWNADLISRVASYNRSVP